MSEAFDPYHRWLSISPKDQPPNHYRLLGIELFEHDPEVIRDAAERQAAHVHRYQLGPHSAISQKILNELAAAKACLLDPAKKVQHDQKVRDRLPATSRAIPAAPPPAIAASLDIASPAPPAWTVPHVVDSADMFAAIGAPQAEPIGRDRRRRIQVPDPLRPRRQSSRIIGALVFIALVLVSVIVGMLLAAGQGKPSAPPKKAPPEKPASPQLEPDTSEQPQPQPAQESNATLPEPVPGATQEKPGPVRAKENKPAPGKPAAAPSPADSSKTAPPQPPVITKVTLTPTSLTNGGKVTLTLTVSSATPVNKLSYFFNGPKGIARSEASPAKSTKMSPGVWQFTATKTILQGFPTGRYFFKGISVQNEAQLQSDEWKGELSVTVKKK